MPNNATGFDRIYIACGYTDLCQGIDGLCVVIFKCISFISSPLGIIFFCFTGEFLRMKVVFALCAVLMLFYFITNIKHRKRSKVILAIIKVKLR